MPRTAVLCGMAGIVLAVTVLAIASHSSEEPASSSRNVHASATAAAPPTPTFGLPVSP